MKLANRLVDQGFVPEVLLRSGIRSLLRRRLRDESARFGHDTESVMRTWVEHMRQSPIALVPELANEQHYEVPAEFFRLVLGKRLKYSSAFFAKSTDTLDQAEETMLALTAERAGLEDGQDVLELGCGWGSLTLWLAERHPKSRIVAVSNSATQREHILERASERSLRNVTVLTADMNDLKIDGQFDRVVSVEMFEHMRNWERLLGRVARWLRHDGRLFLHVFAHQRFAYAFEERDDSDWMSRHFFSGGMMPCHGMVERLDVPFESVESWIVPGTHYARTAEAWLQNLEARRASVLELFERTYGSDRAELWYQRWRVFFLACAELFGFRGGSEWIVSHALLRPLSSQILLDSQKRAR